MSVPRRFLTRGDWHIRLQGQDSKQQQEEEEEEEEEQGFSWTWIVLQ